MTSIQACPALRVQDWPARLTARGDPPKTVSRNSQSWRSKCYTPINRKTPRLQGDEAHERHASEEPRAAIHWNP